MEMMSDYADGADLLQRIDGGESGGADESTAARLRILLESCSTGIAIVTTAGRGTTMPGVITTSFSSVSLEPPAMMWSFPKSSSQHDVFCAAQEFAVHLLDPEHAVLAKHFAGKHVPAARLKSLRPRGGPALFDCRARLDCHAFATHDAGERTIIAARVASFEEHPGERLLFHRRRFGYVLPVDNVIER